MEIDSYVIRVQYNTMIGPTTYCTIGDATVYLYEALTGTTPGRHTSVIATGMIMRHYNRTARVNISRHSWIAGKVLQIGLQASSMVLSYKAQQVATPN